MKAQTIGFHEVFLNQAQQLTDKMPSTDNSPVYIYLHACLNNAFRALKSAVGIPEAEEQMRVEIQRYSGLISILNNARAEDLMLQEVLIQNYLIEHMKQTFRELELLEGQNKKLRGEV